MPSSVAAAWAAAEGYVAASILEAGFWGSVSSTIGVTATTALVFAGQAAIQVGTQYAITRGLSSLLSSGGSGGANATPSANGSAFGAMATTRTHMLRSTIANRQMVYGQAMISGPVVFATSNDNYGTLHLVIALCHGESEEIGDVYFNDEPLGPLDANGYPTSGRYYQPTSPGGTLVVQESDAQLVNRTPATQFQFKYVTLPQAPVSITITDTGLTTANNPTGTPYFDGGGTWTNVGFDNVAQNMRKNNPSDAGLGYIPWRQFGVNGTVIKMSASASNGANITITYTTASGTSYLARIRKHLGSPDQAADAELVAMNVGWTPAHRLRGVTYLIASLVYSKDVYPRGIPNIKAVVKGRKLYDIRTGLTLWSDNPKLQERDYLTHPLGFGCDDTEIDDASVIASANICDELVTVDALGTTQKRYTSNGVVDLGQRPTDVLNALISSNGGTDVWQAGKWLLHAGAYTAPVGAALTMDDLRGALRVEPRVPRADLFNAVRGTFVDPARGWLPQDFPMQRNSAYVAADGGEEIPRDLTLPFTCNAIMAQRVAKMAMDRARQGIVVTWPGMPRLLDVCVGDTKAITLPHLGWVAKEFRVISWSRAETAAIDLILQEEAAASYAWNYGDATLIDPAPDTQLVAGGIPDAPWSVTHTESLYLAAPGVVGAAVTLAWIGETQKYRIDWRSPAGPWNRVETTATVIQIGGVTSGVHEFLIYAVDVIDRVSLPYTYAPYIYGKLKAPGDVSTFTVINNNGAAAAAWAATADLDVKVGGRVVVRHSPLTTGATWINGIILDEFSGDAIGAALPLMTGTYMAKFIDSTGNYSDNEASFVATEALVTGWVTDGTSTQHTVFTGAKSGTVVVDSTLLLDGATPIDSIADLMDDWAKMDSLGGIAAAGSYDFSAPLDLATVAVRRFDATIGATSFDTGDMLDSRINLIDGWSDFDGSSVNDCDATLFISTTDDDPTGSPAWGGWVPFFVGDFSCRAARFRLDLASGSATHNIAIDTLSVRARHPA
ncbi:MAG: hypothetical protein KJ787_13880 [Gammaproteobacteria bacterium]|nr:hypothetical protein [Gammaproteobacteria bacterium]MBU1647416.1 hypothetical protein [Gammaproteobacteria bacterium]MBU1973208.1 hypothetical protein [Gammaproteobacteria bacterium]